MNTSKIALFILAVALAIACRKTETPPPAANGNFTTVDAFLAQNAPALQTYTIDATKGGSFTSPQGTKVIIPANAFINPANQPVSGNVTITFKDLYKKSDMLFADVSTALIWGAPLKSAGEFFIKAVKDDMNLNLANGKFINIEQPAALTGGLDNINIMAPFAVQDSVTKRGGWTPDPMDSVKYGADKYIFSMYRFKSPLDSGSWCNSDNETYFKAYTQTLLTLKPTDKIDSFKTSVYLVFKNITSMVHVYDDNTNFPYYYAPVGLQCTMVAIGVNKGNLYSAFVPFTISANQVVNFTLSKTTAADFKAQLKALD